MLPVCNNHLILLIWLKQHLALKKGEEGFGLLLCLLWNFEGGQSLYVVSQRSQEGQTWDKFIKALQLEISGRSQESSLWSCKKAVELRGQLPTALQAPKYSHLLSSHCHWRTSYMSPYFHLGMRALYFVLLIILSSITTYVLLISFYAVPSWDGELLTTILHKCPLRQNPFRLGSSNSRRTLS